MVADTRINASTLLPYVNTLREPASPGKPMLQLRLPDGQIRLISVLRTVQHKATGGYLRHVYKYLK